MKIGIYVKPSIDVDEEISTLLISKISEYNLDFDSDNPDIVIFVGGDGTLLRAAHEYIDRLDNISFIGVNKGSLAFCCDYNFDEIDQLFMDIVNDNYKKQPLNLLEADLEDETIFAINEIRIENPFHTLISEVYIDDELLETFRGNGLNVSTSFGSSGYNRSLGGALLPIDMNALQLTEIAPISNRIYGSINSPLVIKEDSVITFKGDFSEAVIGYDHLTKKKDNLSEIKLYLSYRYINILYKNNHSYYAQVKKALLK